MKRCHRLGASIFRKDAAGNPWPSPRFRLQPRSTPDGITTTQWKAFRKARSQMRTRPLIGEGGK